MLQLNSARKNKIHLADYNFEQDIENRMLIADFSSFDLAVLEEILYSSLKIPIQKLVKNLNCSEEKLLPILKKLARSGLLSIQDDAIAIDKEMRKYFEFQIARFEPDFKPDMEFIQGILRRVPIHVLPIWYSIPRTSNNIFESIVEKYLLSPQAFQRHLSELHFSDAEVRGIMQDLFSAPDLKISSSDLIAKYNLTRRRFEEILLLLEFNFVCTLVYEQQEGHWTEWVTPFHEWKEYLLFIKKTEAPPVTTPVARREESDFAFIETMVALLLEPTKESQLRNQALEKLKQLQLLDAQLKTTEQGREWLSMSMEAKALFLYRHPLNRILTSSLPDFLATEKNIREAEKAVKRALHGKWIFFDDFLRGLLISFDEKPQLQLKRRGKLWFYALPSYTEAERELVRATLFEWLFEMGMVATGTSEGRPCFCVTAFGRLFFAD